MLRSVGDHKYPGTTGGWAQSRGRETGETIHWHCCLVWALIPRSRGNGSGWVYSDDCINREKGVFSQMRVTESSPSSVQAPAASVGFKAGILFVHLYFTKGFIPCCLIWSPKSSEVGRICYIPNLQMSILKSRGVYPKVTMIVSGRAGSQSHIQRYWPNFSMLFRDTIMAERQIIANIMTNTMHSFICCVQWPSCLGESRLLVVSWPHADCHQ